MFNNLSGENQQLLEEKIALLEKAWILETRADERLRIEHEIKVFKKLISESSKPSMEINQPSNSYTEIIKKLGVTEEKLKITKITFQKFLKIAAEKQVPVEQLPVIMEQMVKRYKSLLKDIKILDNSDDQEIKQLIQKSIRLLRERVDLDQAEKLINQAHTKKEEKDKVKAENDQRLQQLRQQNARLQRQKELAVQRKITVQRNIAAQQKILEEQLRKKDGLDQTYADKEEVEKVTINHQKNKIEDKNDQRLEQLRQQNAKLQYQKELAAQQKALAEQLRKEKAEAEAKIKETEAKIKEEKRQLQIKIYEEQVKQSLLKRGELSAKTPFDWWILLVWILWSPNKLKHYREIFGQESEQYVASWLASTLVWLPFLLWFFALAIFSLNITWGNIIICSIVIVIWFLTGFFGYIKVMDSSLVGIISSGIASIIGIGMASIVGIGAADIMSNRPTINIAEANSNEITRFALITGVIAAFIIGGAKNNEKIAFVAFIVTFIAAFIISNIVVFILQLIPFIVGVVIFIIIFTLEFKIVTITITHFKKGLEMGRPSYINRFLFILLIASYVFLIWLFYLKGWQYFK